MGVTKQAAQKRFVAKAEDESRQDFSRFTDRARQVIVAAQNAARAGNSATIAPVTWCWACSRSRRARREGDPAPGGSLDQVSSS
jgi:hypothetical protein